MIHGLDVQTRSKHDSGGSVRAWPLYCGLWEVLISPIWSQKCGLSRICHLNFPPWSLLLGFGVALHCFISFTSPRKTVKQQVDKVKINMMSQKTLYHNSEIRERVDV